MVESEVIYRHYSDEIEWLPADGAFYDNDTANIPQLPGLYRLASRCENS